MANKKPQKRSAKFKLRVGLEALKGQKTLNEIASEYEVNPSLVSKWKKQMFFLPFRRMPNRLRTFRQICTPNCEVDSKNLHIYPAPNCAIVIRFSF